MAALVGTLLPGLPLAGLTAAAAEELNQLTPAQASAGWKLLFDGQTTAGWRGFKQPSFPTKGWVVEEGCLKHLPKGGGGDIVTVGQYKEFEFEADWRIGPTANSGIKYFILEERGSAIGHEYQIIDALGAEDAKLDAKQHTASFYDVLAPAVPPPQRPLDEFNHTRIVVRGNHVEHWLNGVKVLAYELGSDEVRAAVAKSKFRNVSGFGTLVLGHILLQDHGGEVWFRNLRIRPL